MKGANNMRAGRGPRSFLNPTLLADYALAVRIDIGAAVITARNEAEHFIAQFNHFIAFRQGKFLHDTPHSFVDPVVGTQG